MILTKLFTEFFESEKSGGIVLLLCTVVSLILTNSAAGADYYNFWHAEIGGHMLTHWINDGLMAFFFLLIGLEIEREIYIGELRDIKNTLFPVFSAVGGMIFPAAIFLLLNYGTPEQSGAGIPMATDIAFAVGILSLLGNRVPLSLKVFLVALAIIDDLGAILTIALFYSKGISFFNLGMALGLFAGLLLLNRLKVYHLAPYMLGGIAMWYFMSHSGIHATIVGVLMAFAVPFGDGGEKSPSYILQHILHKPVSFIILPLFALANSALVIENNWTEGFTALSSVGIFLGLVIGKPLGISLMGGLVVLLGWSSLPEDLKWSHIIGVGFLAGIGFTMSIFITLLAYEQPGIIASSKIAIFVSSLSAALIGLVWLRIALRKYEMKPES